MSGPAVSVFLPSYNKAAWVADAIGSVLAQDMPDLELWILENSDDGGATRGVVAPFLADRRVVYEEITLGEQERLPVAYPTAILLNRYYGKAAGEFIAYISDDDVWEPCLLSRCLAEFGAHPGWDAVWFTMWRTVWNGDRFRPAGSIPAVNAVGVGTGQAQADCRVDGGQVVHRRSCLEQLGQPWFPEVKPSAHHADGVFLQKLANLYPLWPVPDYLMTHRVTPASTWDRPEGRA